MVIRTIGLDIGGATIKAGVVCSNQALFPADPLIVPVDEGHLLPDVVALVEAVARDAGPVAGVGVAMPGPFDYRYGVSLLQHKFPALYGRDVKRELERALGLPVTFLNNAEAFAIGAWWMNHLHADRALAMTLGVGLGACFLKHGVAVRSGGDVPQGGELWNAPWRGRPLEEFISQRALGAACADAGLRTGAYVKMLAELARAGNAAATRAFDAFAENIARGIAPHVRRFGAEAILVGGQIAKAYDLFGAQAQHLLSDIVGGETPFFPSRYGDATAILGAGYYALRMEMPTVVHVSRAAPFTMAPGSSPPGGSAPVASIGSVDTAILSTDPSSNVIVYSLSTNDGVSPQAPEYRAFRALRQLIRGSAAYGKAPSTSIEVVETMVSGEAYERFRELSVASWLIYQGGHYEALAMEVDDRGLRGHFDRDYASWRSVGRSIADKILEFPRAFPIVIHDPYYFAPVAESLRDAGYEGKLVGVNHTSFPDAAVVETSFRMMLGEERWREGVSLLLGPWLAFDEISFHTQADQANFLSLMKAFFDGRCPPACRVNPIGVDRKNIRQALEGFDRQEGEALLRLVLEHAPGLRSPDDLRGAIILSAVGNRRDPDKHLHNLVAAVGDLLEVRPDLVGNLVAVIQARGHREQFVSYRTVQERIERVLAAVNAAHGRPGYQPVIFIPEALPYHRDLFRLSRALSDVARLSIVVAPPGAEGFCMAPLESVVAAAHETTNDVSLVVSRGLGLGYTLEQRKIYPVIAAPFAGPSDIAQRILAILDAAPEQRRRDMRRLLAYARTYDLMHWSDAIVAMACASLRRRR